MQNNNMCPECEDTGYIRDLCYNCNGTGEGYYDGSTCVVCRGWGVSYSICSCQLSKEKEFNHDR